MARQKKYSVPIVGIGGRDDIGNMRQFVKRHGLDVIPNVADVSGKVWANAGVRGQPTWIFIDGAGKAETVFGLLDDGELESRLAALQSS